MNDEIGWHLKKEIQLGHIITTLTVAISVVVYTQKIEQRVALVEQSVQAQRDRDERQDKTNTDAFDLIRKQLERIDTKLDRIADLKR